MNQNYLAGAIYKTHLGSEVALQHSEFDTKKLSSVGSDSHTDEHAVGSYNAGDRMKLWAETGFFPPKG